MKTIFYILSVIIFIRINEASAQIPTYSLRIWNLQEISNISLEFEIRIEHTNAPVAFEYSAGQYFISFDNSIANGGTLTYSLIDSELPAHLRPRNPSVGTANNPSTHILKLDINPFPGSGNGFIMTNNRPPGTLIAKMRLTTTASQIGGKFYDLNWRNPPIITFATKIFVTLGTSTIDVTTPATHHNANEVYINSIKVFFTAAIEGLFNPQTFRLNREDSITVYLRDAASPYSIRDSAKNVLDSISRNADFHFFDAPTGTYYMVIKHLNSLETWTSAGGVYLETSTHWSFGFDFINLNTWAYGQNVKRVGIIYCIYSGDVNQDGTIDGSDLSLIYNDAYNFSNGRFIPSDLNGDNFVDGSDILIGESNAINFVSVIRPLP